MHKLVFFDNLATTLSAAVPSDQLSNGYQQNIYLTEQNTENFSRLYDMEAYRGKGTYLTLSHPGEPGIHEVVLCLGYDNYDGYFVIERLDGSQWLDAWPAGTVVEARVTARMLRSMSGGTQVFLNRKALSLNNGDVALDYDAYGGVNAVREAYALGGMPIAPARGFGEGTENFAQQVEGVGYSALVELGVPPTFEEGKWYVPGDFVKSPTNSSLVYCLSRSGYSGDEPPELGDWPWAQFNPASDSNYVSFQRLMETDTWFYPTEIGFICEDFGATSAPSITVWEVDISGSHVGKLVDNMQLTGLSTRKRVVLTNTVTKGIKGLYMQRTTAAAGGTVRGRFYWKGLFIQSNTEAGYNEIYNNGNADSAGELN